MKARALQPHVSELLDRADRTAELIAALISAVESLYADEDPPDELAEGLDLLHQAKDVFDAFEEPAD